MFRRCAMRLWHDMPGVFHAMLMVAVLALSTLAARAQDAPPLPLLAGGDGVITGFSGTVEQAGKPFINLDGASAKIMALSRTGPAFGQLEVPPVRREIPAREVGQVFGIAIDNMVPANVYLGATAAFGLRIVVPDADGDGIPEIALKGQADAQWMAGQWGPGGGPGSIWRVNGATGVAELFATLPNSGPGLGNIAYDPFRYQLFVSNLDDGLIYRLDLNGNIIDTYDHGVTGRPAAGMTPVADDGSKADITSPDFSVENTNTWGLTDIRRQVWGLAVHGDRLYYAVATGPEGGAQIWSVGINIDGSLAADARVEIAAVPGGLPVSDMLFTPSGRMILAQRGMFLNSLDNTRFHIPGADRVLRYRRDPKTGQWIQEPQEYAVGFPRPYRNASGGVALSCAGRLWVSGDQLRNDPEVVPDPPYVVNGLQRMHQRLVKPRNMPPFAAVFVDYDGTFGDAQNAGHVGDVEVYRDCIGTPRPPRGWLPPAGWTPPDLFKEGLQCVRDAETGDLLCDYAIYAYNWRRAPRTGSMIFYDIPGTGVSLEATLGASLSFGGSLGFSCSQPGGPGTPIKCESSGAFSLDFGAFVELKLRTRIPAASIAVELPAGEEAWKVPALANCVAWEADGTPTSCTVSTPGDPWPVPRKDLVYCEKADDGSHECTLLLTFRNDGAGTFEGTATITDEVGPGVRFVRDDDGFDTDGFTPLGWTCAQPGGAGTPIECKTDAPVSIGPGEQVDVLVTVNIPADAGPKAWRDCAVIDEHGPKACIDVKQPPRLAPRKERRECRRNDDAIVCEYIFRIRNDGTGVHDGPLTITDSVGPAATLITTDAGGSGPDGAITWTCAQPGGTGNSITCTSDDPVRLDPGEEATVGAVAIRYPPDAKPEDIADCAFIEEGGPKSCLPGNIKEPKLDLGKALQDCRRDGENWVCTYAITITNTGGGAYNGPLNFSDDVGPQTTYVSHDPAGDWTCSQTGVGADIECSSSAAVNLAPGASVSVNLTTSTPAGFPPDYYRDCAVLKTQGGRGRACVDVSPPPPPEPRLQTEKDDTECTRDGDAIRCTWNIRVTNVGSGPFSGDIIVGDMLPVPGATLAGLPTGSIPWLCTTSGATFRCEGNTTLAPGDSATLQATFTFPADSVANYQQVRNCAVGGRRDALPMSARRKQAGQGNLLPFMTFKKVYRPSPDDNICERVRLPEGLTCDCGTGQLPPEPPTGQPPSHADHVDMNKALKECRRVEGSAGEAWQCTYVITVSKLGSGSWTGQLSMRDDVGPDVSFVPPAAGSTAWNCSQAGTGADIQCTTAGSITLNQGDAATLEITTSMPLDKAQSEENRTDCALLGLQGAELRKCLTVDAPPSGQPRLNLNKESAGCTREGNLIRCTWRITLTNTGDAPYTGRLRVADLAPGSGFVSASGSDGLSWTCLNSSFLTGCESAETTLAPGASTTLTLTTAAGAPGGQTKVPNCAFTRPPDGSHPAGASGGDINVDGLPRLLKEKSGQSGRPKSGGLVIDSGSSGTGADRDDNAQHFVDNFCKPDSGMAIRPFPGGGCDCAIARLPQQQPVSKPVCPAGTQTFPKGVQLPQGFTLVKTLDDGTQCAAYQQIKAPSLPPVETPGPGFVSGKPECRANERTLRTRREASRYEKRGWKVRKLGKGGTAIWCATPPARAQCREGWLPVRGADLRKLGRQGWRFYSIKRRGRVVQWCGKPGGEILVCPPGWKAVSPNAIPALKEKGWRIRVVGGRLYCAAEPAMPLCPPGYKPVPADKVDVLRSRGWKLRRIARDKWCGAPGAGPQCPQGWERVPANRVAELRKRGWKLRRIARGRWCGTPGGGGGGSVICRKPAFRSGKGCACPPGYERRVINVSRGRIVTCQKRQGTGPRQCKPGFKWVDGRCRPIVIQCPPGFRRVKGRCVPRVIIDCPRGMKLVRGRCVRIQRPPTNPRNCPKGTVRARNGRCIPVRINPDVLRNLGRTGTRPRTDTRKQPQLRVQGGIRQRYTPPPVRCGKGFVLRNGRCVPAIKLY